MGFTSSNFKESPYRKSSARKTVLRKSTNTSLHSNQSPVGTLHGVSIRSPMVDPLTILELSAEDNNNALMLIQNH